MTEGSGFGSYLSLMNLDPRGPKTYGSHGSGSGKLLRILTIKNTKIQKSMRLKFTAPHPEAKSKVPDWGIKSALA
jgi:hypothetical protein